MDETHDNFNTVNQLTWLLRPKITGMKMGTFIYVIVIRLSEDIR